MNYALGIMWNVFYKDVVCNRNWFEHFVTLVKNPKDKEGFILKCNFWDVANFYKAFAEAQQVISQVAKPWLIWHTQKANYFCLIRK